jgi:hypothetical protein
MPTNCLRRATPREYETIQSALGLTSEALQPFDLGILLF